MSTGDIRGNLSRLLRALSSVRYPLPKNTTATTANNNSTSLSQSQSLFEEALLRGDPAAYLPLLHYVLLSFSKHVASLIIDNGYELTAKTDYRYVGASESDDSEKERECDSDDTNAITIIIIIIIIFTIGSLRV